MIKMQENTVKYLAGLCDADASLSFRFNQSKEGWRLHLIFNLTAAESIDREGKFIKSLPDLTGFGTVRHRQREHWSPINEWVIQSQRDMNMFLPRITKYMVIKGKHWDTLYGIFVNTRGKILNEAEVKALKQFSKESRKNTGPLKAKKHPTWAWTCGYLEGDGCFTFKKHPSGYGKILRVSATSHKNDTQGLELLQKAFGGTIVDRKHDNCAEWKRNLGKREKSFTEKFLPKLIQHSKLKRYKMEQMLSYLYNQQDSQRLTEKDSAE